MELTVTRHEAEDGGAVASLTLSGFLDLSTRQELIDQGSAALEEGRSLILDLSAVEFMDSSGIGALAQLAKSAASLGRSFHLSAVSPRVERVLAITGLADEWRLA